jgi:hypothetical protein
VRTSAVKGRLEAMAAGQLSCEGCSWQETKVRPIAAKPYYRSRCHWPTDEMGWIMAMDDAERSMADELRL